MVSQLVEQLKVMATLNQLILMIYIFLHQLDAGIFSDTFNYDGAIQPDILVKRRIFDIANKADSTLEKALEVLCMGKDN